MVNKKQKNKTEKKRVGMDLSGVKHCGNQSHSAAKVWWYGILNIFMKTLSMRSHGYIYQHKKKG